MNSATKIFVVLCCYSSAIISMDERSEYEPTGTVFSTTAPIFTEAASNARQFVRKNAAQINAIEDIEKIAHNFTENYKAQHPVYPDEFLNLIKKEIYRTILSSKMKIKTFMQQAENEASDMHKSSLKKNVAELVTLFKQKHNIPEDEEFDQIVDAFRSKLEERPVSRSPQQSPLLSPKTPAAQSLQISSATTSPQLAPKDRGFASSQLSSPSESSLSESSFSLTPRTPRKVTFEPTPYQSTRKDLSNKIITALQRAHATQNPYIIHQVCNLLKETQVEEVLGKPTHPLINPQTNQPIRETHDIQAHRAFSKILKKPHVLHRLTDEQLKDTEQNLSNFMKNLQP